MIVSEFERKVSHNLNISEDRPNTIYERGAVVVTEFIDIRER